MPTKKKIVRFGNKQLITQQQWRNLKEFLDLLSRNGIKQVYDLTGVFTPVTFTFATDAFNFSPSPFESIDTLGNVLEWDTTNFPDQKFENESGIVYQAAVHYVSIPDGILNNPRTLTPQYQEDRDEIGDVGEPDLAIDPADGTVKLKINGILRGTTSGTNTSHAGRSATVFLKSPVISSPTEAFETATITHDGTDNFITVPSLGQGTTPSTTASDYQVFVPGATIRRVTQDVDITTGGNELTYIFIGTVTGVGLGSPPTVSSTAGQVDLSVSLALINLLFTEDHNSSTGAHDDVKTFNLVQTNVTDQVTFDVHVSDLDGDRKLIFKNNSGEAIFTMTAKGIFHVGEDNTDEADTHWKVGRLSKPLASPLEDQIADQYINRDMAAGLRAIFQFGDDMADSGAWQVVANGGNWTGINGELGFHQDIAGNAEPEIIFTKAGDIVLNQAATDFGYVAARTSFYSFNASVMEHNSVGAWDLSSVDPASAVGPSLSSSFSGGNTSLNVPLVLPTGAILTGFEIYASHSTGTNSNTIDVGFLEVISGTAQTSNLIHLAVATHTFVGTAIVAVAGTFQVSPVPSVASDRNYSLNIEVDNQAGTNTVFIHGGKITYTYKELKF